MSLEPGKLAFYGAGAYLAAKVCTVATVGAIALYGFAKLGPIDLVRTGYSTMAGETALLKRQLFEYVKEGVDGKAMRLHNLKDHAMITGNLHEALEQRVIPGQAIDPQKVPMSVLWDASEEYAHSASDSFFGPRFR